MYKQFYGLREKPFHIVPNPSFLFLSPKHQNALTYLEYGLMEKVGFVMLTGDIGTGKTTLIRYLLEKIESEMEVAVIFNTNVSPDQIIDLILQEFEIEPIANDKAKSIDLLYQFLIDRYAAGKQVLLIIDEAQNLSREALEEIRMLSNLQTDEEMLLQIMIVGQPELRDKLKNPNLTQFAQRIAVSYHLSPLSGEETGQYISHRLTVAGGDTNLFSQEAIDKIFEASFGIPRTINLLCDAALVYGFADELRRIDIGVIDQIIEDKGGMGLLPVASQPAEHEPTEIPDETIDTLIQRIESLEAGLTKLQGQIGWLVKELDKRSAGMKNELVNRLKYFLLLERKRYDKLLLAHGRLQERYQRLRNRLEKTPSDQASPHLG